MKNTEQALQEATEARRALQQATIRDEAAIERAITIERMARYEVSRFALATMPEGKKFWATGL